MSSPENTTELRLAGIVRESIVDGPGLRLTVFTQGCPHRCPGCHNPETHDPAGGYVGNIDKILEAVDANPLLRGITLSGGEPMDQPEALLPLARAVIARGKDIVCFSGYTFAQLMAKSGTRPAVGELLSLCFLLIDGPFILAERDLSLRFRGSRNQRLLDVQKSLAAGSPVEWRDEWPIPECDPDSRHS